MRSCSGCWSPALLCLVLFASSCGQPQRAVDVDATQGDAVELECEVSGPVLSWPAKLAGEQLECSAGEFASRMFSRTHGIYLVLNEPPREVCHFVYSCGSHATTILAVSPPVGSIVEGWELTAVPAPGTTLPPVAADDPRGLGAFVSPPSVIDPSWTHRICARTSMKVPAALPYHLTVTIESDDCVAPIQQFGFEAAVESRTIPQP